MIAMKKMTYSFSLSELEELDEELNGKKDPNGVSLGDGLMDSVINLKLKFILSSLNNVIENYRKKMLEYRDKLIYKLGTKNEAGVPEIHMYIYEEGKEPQPNPIYLEFEKQYGNYLTKKIKIESYPVDLDLLETVARQERFPMLFKYLEQQYVEEEK